MTDHDAEAGDELPEDLQPHLVDPEDYIFPNNNRRRIPGYLYLGTALLLVGIFLLWGDHSYVNRGYLGAAAILGAIGAYSIVVGWNLDIDERDALVASVAAVGFPVGHASAQMGWRGLLSRPTWRMLLYSADEPPSQRAFVLVDGVDGTIVDHFVEANPEDWSELVDTDRAGPASDTPETTDGGDAPDAAAEGDSEEPTGDRGAADGTEDDQEAVGAGDDTGSS